MTPDESHDKDWLNSLPLLTEVVEEETPDDFPTLTEAIITESVTEPERPLAPPPRLYTEQEVRQLLQRLETRIETVFADRLRQQLEQLHQQTVEQTIAELKAGLPGLLQDALDKHPESR